MPVTRETVTYDVHDFKVYPLLTDPGTGPSPTPTYGPAIDVPGIAEVSMDPNLLTQELKGDARIIAKKGRTDKITGSATYGKLSLNVLAAVLSGTVTDSGSTPNQKAKYSLKGANSLPYFKCEFVINDVEPGLGNVLVRQHKCQLTGGTLLGQSSDEFGQPSFEWEAIPLDSTDDLLDIEFNETLTPVAS